MENISLNKKPIQLISGVKYIVIDALYIEDIKKEIPALNSDNILVEIRKKIFPYTDTPFAEYVPLKSTFTLNQIKKVGYNIIKPGDYSALSTDSSVLIFANEEIFLDFVSKFEYHELVNSSVQLLNTNYWYSITAHYSMCDTAIIVAPDVNADVDFDGSGTYRIT